MNGNFLEEFGGIMKKLFVNEGAMAKGQERAIETQYRKAGEMVMQNSADSTEALNKLRDSRKWAKQIAKDRGETSKRAMMVDESMARRAHADKNFDGDMLAATKQATNDYEKALNRNTKWEAAKGYFTDPMRDLKSADAATRHMAVGQLAARSAAVAGGTIATGSIINDLFSDDENDVGFGTGVGNTLGGAALAGGGAAAAAGISMLKKL